MLDLYEKVLKDFSVPRVAFYKNFLQHNCAYVHVTPEQSYNFYCWSELLNSYFWRCLSRVEVLLRNRINDVLVANIDNKWVFPNSHEGLKINLGKAGSASVVKAVEKVQNSGLGLTNGQVVSELTMGFWVNFHKINFLHANTYKKSKGIGWEYFIPSIFPGYVYPQSTTTQEYRTRYWLKKGRVKNDITRRLIFINILRNRIAHHEHIFKEKDKSLSRRSDDFLTNTRRNYSNILEVLHWLSPEQCHLYKQSNFHCYADYLMSQEGFDYHVLNKREDMNIDDFTDIAMSSMDDGDFLRTGVIHVSDKDNIPIGVFIPFSESQR